MFTSKTIEKIYKSCLWKDNELEGNCMKVDTPRRVAHLLHRRKVAAWQTRIVRTLKFCQSMCLRSVGGGAPWQAMRISRHGTELDLSYTDKLIALGIAAGFVTIEQRTIEGIDGTVAYAVIEDVRVRNHGFRYGSGRQNFRLKKGWGVEELKK